jgi:hypothetical protein
MEAKSITPELKEYLPLISVRMKESLLPSECMNPIEWGSVRKERERILNPMKCWLLLGIIPQPAWPAPLPQPSQACNPFAAIVSKIAKRAYFIIEKMN